MYSDNCVFGKKEDIGMCKKLILKRIFAGALAILLSCLVLASCSNGGGGGDESTTDASGETDVEPLDLSSMDLSPYISLGQYKNVPVTVDETEYLVSLREAMRDDNAYFSFVTDGTYTPSGSNDTEIVVDESRTVEEGDIINVDYKGYLDGVAFDGGTASGQEITVFETGTYIDGFASGFIGTAVGDSSSFLVTFPEAYGSEYLAGKEVTFEFTVNYIYEFDALTDEIVTDLSGGEFTTVADYENDLRTAIVAKYLWETVVANATLIEYPEQQVLYYYQQNRKFYEYYATYYSMTYEDLLANMGMSDEDLYVAAQELVFEDLVYYAVVDAENITLSETEKNERLDAYVARYVKEFGYTEAEIQEKHLDSIYDAMLYDKMQETLISYAKVTWE